MYNTFKTQQNHTRTLSATRTAGDVPKTKALESLNYLKAEITDVRIQDLRKHCAMPEYRI